MENELLPCPACGGEAFGPFAAYEGVRPEDQKYVISCTRQITCGLMLSGVGIKTAEMAIAAWNTRAPLVAQPQQDGEMDTITNIIVRASEEQSGECYNAAHAKLIELVLDSKPQQWNEAIDELFSLISLDGGRWCFNSLSRDAPKFDAVMTRLSAIRNLTRTSKEQEEAAQPGLGARSGTIHQGKP